MAKNFGVSSTPIRDALNKLVKDELIIVKPRIGFFVAKFTKDYLSEVYEIRKMMECFALKNTKNHNYKKYKNFLKQSLTIKNIILTPEGYNQCVFLDKTIHLNIIKGFGNKQFIKIYFNIYSIIQISQNLGMLKSYISKDIEEIILFLEKMVNKDILNAEIILREHLENSKIIGIRSFKKHYSK